MCLAMNRNLCYSSICGHQSVQPEHAPTPPASSPESLGQISLFPKHLVLAGRQSPKVVLTHLCRHLVTMVLPRWPPSQQQSCLKKDKEFNMGQKAEVEISLSAGERETEAISICHQQGF